MGRIADLFARLRRAPAKPANPARPAAPAKPAAPARTPKPAAPPRTSATPPRGRHLEYSPKLDGHADPGEIVWTWVPFEEDASQGKDRPVLVVGRDGRRLYGLMLSSNHERDGQPHWLALGAGDWDRAHRPSWLRLDRILDVHEDAVRREGAIVDRTRFARVAAILRRSYGWR